MTTEGEIAERYAENEELLPPTLDSRVERAERIATAASQRLDNKFDDVMLAIDVLTDRVNDLQARLDTGEPGIST